MFFSRLICALSLVCGLFGCARENEPAAEAVVVNLGSSECLSDFGKRISDFANERLSESQVRQTWDCTAQAISDFQRLTVPDASGHSYTSVGLRHFLERYFIKGSPISDSLLVGIMHFKRILVGGTTDIITSAEMERVKELLAEMRDISLDIHGRAGVIFMTRESASDLEMREATILVEAAGQRLGRWIQKNNQSYSFAELLQLIKDIHEWNGPSEDGDRVFEKIKKVIAIMPQVKQVLIAGQSEVIAGSEWERTVNSIVRAYSGFLSSYYSFDDLNAGMLRRGLPHTMDRFADLLDEGVRARGGKPIPAAQFAAIFDSIEKAGWLSSSIKPGAMMKMWVWFAGRTLQGKSGSGDVSQSQVNRLRAEALNWNTLLDYSEGRKVAQTPDIRRFEKVLAASTPMQWDKDDRMLFAKAVPKGWSGEGKRHMVWPYIFVNLLREVYGTRDSYALTEPQVLSAVGEILPLLQGFGWLLKTETSIGSRLVREANLFTQSGNGDDDLDMGEAIRYVTFAASAFRVSEIWTARARQSCGQTYAAPCLRTLGISDPDILSAMPRLKAELKGKPNKVLENYMRQAEETILEAIPVDSYGTGDLTMVMMLFQYVETFYSRFDADNDERIRLDEAGQAYIIYQNILGRLLAPAGILPEELDVFFTFLMKYGDTPGFSVPPMFGGLVAYNYWKLYPERRALSSDRPLLMSILNQLSKL